LGTTAWGTTVPILELNDLPPSERPYAQSDGQPIFKAFGDPAMMARLRTAALAGIPGAFGAIEIAEKNMRRGGRVPAWDDRKKKFLGRCAALLWRKHGFATAGFSRRMPHPAFTVGEVYIVKDYEPLALIRKPNPPQLRPRVSKARQPR
jgi:hypothetical protein